MLSDSVQCNASTCSLRTFVIRLVLPNDVSCFCSGSRNDPSPIPGYAPPGVRGIFSPSL